MTSFILILSVLIFLFWFTVGLDYVYGAGFQIPVLKKGKQDLPDGRAPKVSIIFAARDEAPKIPAALTAMLAQDYPDYEGVAVNDRSTDGSLAAMQSFSGNPRLKIINVTELPAGWLGKNHALQKGYEAASGEWLIFTDADVVFDPATLRHTVGYAIEHGIHHLAVFPKMVRRGFMETIYTICFGIGFLIYFRPWAAADPKSKAFIGIGAFNLVRRNAYEAIGTHQSFSMNVLDDMELGRKIKSAGFHQAPVFGHELISVAWVEGWKGILKSLEKNGFAGVDYRLGFLALLTLMSVCVNGLPFIFYITTRGAVYSFAFASLLLIFLVHFAGQKINPGTLWVFLFHPLGTLAVLFVVWRSAFLALRDGGIRWRGTFYQLSDLKK